MRRRPKRGAAGRNGNQVDLEILIENVLNALTAGITIGCIYGLMCIGLGLIFGIMRVVNFAQGELLMLGMFASLYLVTGGGILAFLGPIYGPFIGAILAGPIVFVAGALLHKFLIARVSGLRTAGTLDEGHFGQLIVTLGISLILQNGGLIVFGSTPHDGAHAAGVAVPIELTGFYGDATVFLNKARLVACVVSIVVASRAVPGRWNTPASARRCARQRTIRPPQPTWASTSSAPTASRSAWAAASRPSPAG